MSEALNGLEKLVEAPLLIDPFEADRLEEEAVLWDKELAHARFLLYKGPTQLVEGPEAGRDYYQLPFICTSDLPHNLRLVWARLSIKFDQTAKLKIEQLEPQLVAGEEPVSLKTSLSANFSLEFIPLKLGPSFEATQKIYPPKITGSGLHSREAIWTFDPAEDGGVYLSHELKLVVSVPGGTKIDAYFNFKARLTQTGILKLVPVFASGKPIEEIYRLTKED